MTRDNARVIANKMTVEKLKAIIALKKEISSAVTEAYAKSLPKAVVETFNKYPSYFTNSKTSTVTPVGTGLYNKYFIMERELPYTSTYRAPFQVSDTFAQMLSKKSNELDKMEAAYEKLKKDIEVALCTLKTHKRILEQFPEAAKYLPEPMTKALSINVADIRKRL
jgi:predicted ribosome quality control (RQC) complex YloA/Tae2 family protein